MPPTHFRLSLYLALAAACAALGYAEYAVFPEVGVFAAGSVAALAVIYRLETRVRLLSMADANKLAAGIAVVTLVWAGFRVADEIRGESAHSAGAWQIILVALFGPVLMAAIPAKLLRREKHAGDYWELHAAALACAGLAGAMAEDAVSFALMAAYIGLAVWNLALFFVARAGGAVPPIPTRNGDPAPAAVTVGARTGRTGPRVALWVAVAVGLALPPFFLTPRSAAGRVELGSRKRQVGFTPDQMIDLNRTGPLLTTSEVAFEVDAAEDGGRAKDDLNPDQRWRATTRTEYSGGVWQRSTLGPLPAVARPPGRGSGPPDLGPGRYKLTFHLPPGLRGGILSDPVVWAAGEPSPVASVTADGEVPWESALDGTFFRKFGSRTPEYVQYTRALGDPDVGPPLEFEGSALAEVQSPRFVLVANPVRRVKEYADGLLDAMAAAGALPADFRDPIRLLPKPEHREAIARAFARHLSSDAGLTYSTLAKRDRPDLDPVEDFLDHSKVGHCQQFASALVLMLRSQGIPTQLVHGFRGCEGQGDGRYLVRHEHAHVWGEALIVRPKPGEPGKRVWHWLSVDPSPAGPAPADAGVGWWEAAVNRGRVAFNQYFLQYDPDQRDRLLTGAVRGLRRPPVMLGLGAVAVAVLAGVAARRRLRRPAPAADPAVPARWFDQLTAALAPHGFAPDPGATPREFAEGVSAALRLRPATAPHADVPADWAAAYYESRFGGLALPDERRRELEGRLADLCRVLVGRDRGDP